VTYEESIAENARVISEYTFQVYEKLWFENFAQNIGKIWYGRNLRTLIEENMIPKSDCALVIGAGPSVDRFNQLETISKLGFDGTIITCDRMLKPCLDSGVEPHVVVSIDATEQTSRFFEDVDLGFSTFPVSVLNVFSHPKTVENVEKTRSQIYWFITTVDNPMEKKSLTRVIYWMSNGKMIVPGLGNVGAMCWNIACLLGCKKIGLVGMDYGYPPDTKLEDTVYYKAYLKLGEMNNQPIERFYRKIENPLGNEVLVSVNWDVYRHIFSDFSDKASEKFGIETFNLSPISSLFSKSVKYMDLVKFLKKEV